MSILSPGLFLIILCIIFSCLAYFFYKKRNTTLSLLLILLTGLVLRLYVSSDHYLHTWDERYHALVAKNLLKHPLKPTLYDQPLLPYDVENWVANHVWLDKGPIPLWTMALSLNMFGLNEWALRIPSLLISLMAVFLTFRLGKLLFDERTGLLAAFLHSIHGLLIEVAGGRVSSDHVETMFCFFTELSLLIAFTAVIKNKGILYSIAIGLFTGLAVLCKWTPALMVFPVCIAAEWISQRMTSKEIILNLFISLVACAIVVAPWLIYIKQNFPAEAAYVFQKFTGAYVEPLEKHTGPWYYYFQNTGMVFGELVWIAIIAAVYFLFKGKADWRTSVLLLWWFLPFAVFSFAETKRHTYLLITAPALFLITVNSCIQLAEIVKQRKWVRVLLFLALFGLPVRYCIERTKPFAKLDRNPQWAQDLKAMRGNYPPNTVFVNHPHPVEGMFYTDYIFYGHIPGEDELTRLRKSGYEVKVVE